MRYTIMISSEQGKNLIDQEVGIRSYMHLYHMSKHGHSNFIYFKDLYDPLTIHVTNSIEVCPNVGVHGRTYHVHCYMTRHVNTC